MQSWYMTTVGSKGFKVLKWRRKPVRRHAVPPGGLLASSPLGQRQTIGKRKRQIRTVKEWMADSLQASVRRLLSPAREARKEIETEGNFSAIYADLTGRRENRLTGFAFAPRMSVLI